jgi:hypothetical protein
MKVNIHLFELNNSIPTSFQTNEIISRKSLFTTDGLRPQSSNWNPNSDNELLVIGSRMMLMSMLGYFISDLVDILPEWRKHKVELQRVCEADAFALMQRTCVGNQ